MTAALVPPASWFVMGDEESGLRPSLFVVLAHLSLARGDRAINKLVPPGFCYHVPIDERWEAWINPHGDVGVFASEDGMSGKVGPYSVWINYNGWLWSLADYGGQVFGEHPDPRGANLRSFIEAVLAVWPAEPKEPLYYENSGPYEGWTP